MKSKNLIKIGVLIVFLISIPVSVFADTAGSIGQIEGASNLINFFDIWVRGAGALVLMYGCADAFMNFATEHNEHRTRGLKCICAGLLMIRSYSIICAICDIGNYNSFQVLLSVLAVFLEFIGAMSAMYGAYSFFQSIRDNHAEARNRAVRILFGGLAVIAVAQSYSVFLL